VRVEGRPPPAEFAYSSRGVEYIAHDVVRSLPMRERRQRAKALAEAISRGDIPFPFKRSFMSEAETVPALVKELCEYECGLTFEPFELWGYYDEHMPLSVFGKEGPGPLLPGQVHPHTRRLALFGDCPAVFPFDDEKHVRFAALTDYFTEPVRMRSRRSDEPGSPLEMWRDPAFAARVVERSMRKFQEVTAFSLRHAMFALVAGCNVFKPGISKGLFDLFGARRVLDMSAGWGDRLCGALASKGMCRYLAFDPNTALKEGHDGIIRAFAPVRGGGEAQFQVRYEPFEVADLGDERFDLAFSSPPFFDLELYESGDPGTHQSSADYPVADEWKSKFLFASLRNIWEHLEAEGHCCLFINDLEAHSVCRDMLEFCAESLPECHFVGTLGLAAEGTPRIRPIWVWRKGEAVPDLPIYRAVSEQPRYVEPANPLAGSPLAEAMLASKPDMALSIEAGSVSVVREDLLPGGTEQRVLLERIAEELEKRPPSSKRGTDEPIEFVCTCAPGSVMQLALATAAAHRGVLCTLFVQRLRERHPLTNAAEALGATIRQVGLASKQNDAWVIEAVAQSYVKRRNRCSPHSCVLVGSTDVLLSAASRVLSCLIPPSVRPPSYLWVSGDSVMVARALAVHWPHTRMVVTIPEGTEPAKQLTEHVRLIDVVRVPGDATSPLALLDRAATAHARDGDWVWKAGGNVTLFESA
jgi:hypothetical protein